MRGRLIAIEGIDGSGKSVQSSLINRALKRLGCAATIVKAKEARQDTVLKKFLDDFGIKTDSIAFMLLYQALHRRQYETARTAMNAGTVVIADRWDASFFTYHNVFGPLADRLCLLKTLNWLAFENFEPDLYFLLNTPVEVAIARRIARGDSVSSVEQETAFYRKIAAEYLKFLAPKPQCIVLDGTQTIEYIHNQIIEATMPVITGG